MDVGLLVSLMCVEKLNKGKHFIKNSFPIVAQLLLFCSLGFGLSNVIEKVFLCDNLSGYICIGSTLSMTRNSKN